MVKSAKTEMSAEERLALIKRNLQEVIGEEELKKIILTKKEGHDILSA